MIAVVRVEIANSVPFSIHEFAGPPGSDRAVANAKYRIVTMTCTTIQTKRIASDIPSVAQKPQGFPGTALGGDATGGGASDFDVTGSGADMVFHLGAKLCLAGPTTDPSTRRELEAEPRDSVFPG